MTSKEALIEVMNELANQRRNKPSGEKTCRKAE